MPISTSTSYPFTEHSRKSRWNLIIFVLQIQTKSGAMAPNPVPLLTSYCIAWREVALVKNGMSAWLKQQFADADVMTLDVHEDINIYAWLEQRIARHYLLFTILLVPPLVGKGLWIVVMITSYLSHPTLRNIMQVILCYTLIFSYVIAYIRFRKDKCSFMADHSAITAIT